MIAFLSGLFYMDYLGKFCDLKFKRRYYGTLSPSVLYFYFSHVIRVSVLKI